MVYSLGLEVAVDTGLAAHCEAVLGAVVVVAKVVTVASGDEREAEWVVGGRSATIRGPVDSGRIAGVATSSELWECNAEEELVCHCVHALAL